MEITIGIALIAILGGIALVALDPFRQVASARNTQRELHLQAIMNAVRQNIAESSTNSFACAAGSLPTTPTIMRATGGYDIAPCLVPGFMSALPFDPRTPGARYAGIADYDTGYQISQSTSTGSVTLTAPGAEVGKTVTLVR